MGAGPGAPMFDAAYAVANGLLMMETRITIEALERSELWWFSRDAFTRFVDENPSIERELYLEFREPGFAPAPLLEHLVTAGRLGRKTGKGFRDYS